MQVRTISGQSPGEMQSALTRYLADGFVPTLAIVFLSIMQDRQEVSAILDKAGIRIFGSTTAGEFIGGDIAQGSIVVMLMDMPAEWFSIAFAETGDAGTYAIARQIALEGKQLFDRPAFLVGSGGLLTDGEQIVAGVIEATSPEVTLFGGMAGDDLILDNTTVFTNGWESNDGLLFIIFDEQAISMQGLATCGWKPVGTVRTVTKSEGPVVYTIDDEPALDLVLKYLGVKFDLDSRQDVVLNIGAYFPLQVERDNAQPVMRTVMFVNKQDRSLICAGNVKQGSKLRFSLPPDFDVIDTVVEECIELKDAHPSGADAIIMFSCVSRYLSFGEMTQQEIKQIQAVWNCPLIGFFGGGEIGKARNGRPEFHNNTCSIVILKAKS